MRITHMFISPLKSGAMIPCHASVIAQGVLAHDRTFMLVDVYSNEFLSQRKIPRMALINQRFIGADLEFSAPGMVSIQMPWVFMRGQNRPSVKINVWDKEGERLRQCCEDDQEFSAWFSKFLGRKCRLVVQQQRALKQKSVKDLTMNIALHDSSAIHLVTEESLLALEVNEPLEVIARRFRPNIIVRTGMDPFWEDTWDGQVIIINGFKHSHAFLIRKKTSRCQVPGINPITAERDNAPMKVLNSTRRSGKDILFGLYLFPIRPRGTIALGDEIIV